MFLSLSNKFLHAHAWMCKCSFVNGCLALWENQQLTVAVCLPCQMFHLPSVGSNLSSPLSRYDMMLFYFCVKLLKGSYMLFTPLMLPLNEVSDGLYKMIHIVAFVSNRAISYMSARIHNHFNKCCY